MNPGATDPQLVLKATPPRVPKTLLALWRREALRSGAVAAWLTLDERDDDSRPVRGLALAMSMASGRAGFAQA